MPQEFHVLRCYSCGTFQVHIVKKKPAWLCKICGEKQSVQKVYAMGNGKDCRIVVQQLNQQAITQLASHVPEESDEMIPEIMPDTSNINLVSNQSNTPSKWGEFLSPSEVKESISEAPQETEVLDFFDFDCVKDKRGKTNKSFQTNDLQSPADGSCHSEHLFEAALDKQYPQKTIPLLFEADVALKKTPNQRSIFESDDNDFDSVF